MFRSFAGFFLFLRSRNPFALMHVLFSSQIRVGCELVSAVLRAATQALSGSELIEVLVPTLVGSDAAVAEIGLIASTMRVSCWHRPAVPRINRGAGVWRMRLISSVSGNTQVDRWTVIWN
ncbi:UNVERIFIED_ORG: hypothetical protein GGD58_002938 [Rhizobium pisi]